MNSPILKKIKIKKWRNWLIAKWLKCYRIVFVFFSLGFLAVGAFVWYQSLYNAEWSEDKKMEFGKTQNGTIRLREEEFQRLIGKNRGKKEIYDGEVKSVKDIFAPYEGMKEKK